MFDRHSQGSSRQKSERVSRKKGYDETENAMKGRYVTGKLKFGG